jgi:hypothetical protein
VRAQQFHGQPVQRFCVYAKFLRLGHGFGRALDVPIQGASPLRSTCGPQLYFFLGLRFASGFFRRAGFGRILLVVA